jgi:hypothetical protein
MTLMSPHRALRCSILLLLLAGCDPKGWRPAPPIKTNLRPPPPITLAPSPAPQIVASEDSSSLPSPSSGGYRVEAAPPVLPPGVLYADSFADVQGALRRNASGARQFEGPATSRRVYPFLPATIEGSAVLQVVEDSTTNGPDGQPGVLALSWQEVPAALQYSGFSYVGGATAGRQIVLPPVTQAKTADDLQNLRLKFQYRAVNTASDMPVALKATCRLEPDVPESYAKRLDFGAITATDEWQTFEVALSEGANLDAFLQAIASANPQEFKIVWGQYGPIEAYHAGDTLLLDDVMIVESDK